MHILLTNDDGYTAKGLQALIEIARPFGDLTVVAPQYPQSATSMSVSVCKMLRFFPIEGLENQYYCSGSPVDCVKMALNQLFVNQKPDLVLSGINHGSNASTAQLYSGTLGATAEAALTGLPAMAFSLCSHSPNADFSAIIHYGRKILAEFIKNPPQKYTYINVNAPNIPLEEIKGIRFARMGMGKWIKEMEGRIDPYSQPYYWVVGQFVNTEKEDPKCDHNLLDQKYITIVPHQVDTTNYKELNRLEACWNV